jgi:hypothetical protein
MYLKGRRGQIFMFQGEFDSSKFEWEKTRCTACGTKLPNLDITTLTGDRHICLCNRCDNIFLDDLLYIEGLGHICMKDIKGLEHIKYECNYR